MYHVAYCTLDKAAKIVNSVISVISTSYTFKILKILNFIQFAHCFSFLPHSAWFNNISFLLFKFFYIKQPYFRLKSIFYISICVLEYLSAPSADVVFHLTHRHTNEGCGYPRRVWNIERAIERASNVFLSASLRQIPYRSQ